MITINGYTIVQNDYNHHIMVIKDERMVYHAQYTEPLTDNELKNYLMDVIDFIGKL